MPDYEENKRIPRMEIEPGEIAFEIKTDKIHLKLYFSGKITGLEEHENIFVYNNVIPYINRRLCQLEESIK